MTSNIWSKKFQRLLIMTPKNMHTILFYKGALSQLNGHSRQGSCGLCQGISMESESRPLQNRLIPLKLIYHLKRYSSNYLGHILPFFSFWGSLWRACYQQRLPRLVFILIRKLACINMSEWGLNILS